jgi:hypothetical protein
LRVFLFLLLAFAIEGHASFNGTLKSSTDKYPYTLGEPTADLIPYLSLDLGGKHKFTKKFRFQWKGVALANLESESSPEKFYGDLPEGFFELRSSAEFKVRLGMNTVNWGVVDISSPMDVVNTSAFFHPMRSMKRGAPMLELDWDKEVFGVHALYIPRQQRALLPSADSRWLPRKFLVNVTNGYERIVLPEFLEYDFDEPETLDRALDHNAGLRLSSHLGSVDLYAMHFEGSAPSPKVRPTIVVDPGSTPTEGIARSPIHLAPVSYRVRTSGFGFVWAGESLIFRGESAYQHTISDDPLVQPWSWQSVAALETNMSAGSSTITWLLQYYYTKNPQSPDNLISSSYRLFDRTALLGMRWPISEKVLITGSVLYEENAHGTFGLLGFEHKYTDTLKWGLSWRDFYAPEDGLIKTFDRNDHATLDLIYIF